MCMCMCTLHMCTLHMCTVHVYSACVQYMCTLHVYTTCVHAGRRIDLEDGLVLELVVLGLDDGLGELREVL